jgi:hypothetical protein
MAERAYNPFIYPFNKAGLLNIFMIIVVILISRAVDYFLGLSPVFPLLGMLVSLFIFLVALGYFFMYLNVCLNDSAKGGIMAPDTTPDRGGLRDIFEELGWGVAPFVVCLLPSILYVIVNKNAERGIFMILLFAGLFFYPMLSLRTGMMRELAAYNPFGIIFNIIRFLPGYLSLLGGIVVAFLPYVIVSYMTDNSFTAGLFVLPWMIYSFMVLFHLMGRFYYKRRDKLDWE